MSTETTLTPRQRLVAILCDDLNIQGWNQKNKVWFVKGEFGDEYLEFVGEFSGAPEKHLKELASKPRDGVTGLVISTEGWAYPKKLTETFKTEAALRSYWRLVPPSEHPERVEIRHLLFASCDGEVIGLTAHRDTDNTKDWAALAAGQKGDSIVDAARSFLGNRNDSPAAAVAEPLDAIGQLQTVLDCIQGVLEGRLSNEDATVRIFESMPEDQRRQMLADMPDFIKDEFRKALPEHLRKKYGL